MAPQNPNRDYKREAKWASSKEQKLRRAERNRARAKAMARGTVKKGDGKEVDHTRGKRRGKLDGPTRVVTRAENRRRQPKRS